MNGPSFSYKTTRARDSYAKLPSEKLPRELLEVLDVFERELFHVLYPEIDISLSHTRIPALPRLKKSEYYARLYRFLESDHPSVGKIKRKFIELGFAYPLLYGDWDVDRPDETHGRFSGTVPHSRIVQFLTSRFRSEEIERGLKGLILGPGNGYGMHELQKSNLPATTIRLNDGTELQDLTGVNEYWNFIGLCDKIYFPLSQLLFQFWKGDSRVGKEVCDFFMVQIQREVQYWKSNNPGKLHPIQQDLKSLPDFLKAHCGEWLDRCKDNVYTACGEFENDTRSITVSDDCMRVLTMLKKSPFSGIEEILGADFSGEALGEKAPFFFRNIYIGKFDQIPELFGSEEKFHFISSVRGTSHVDNEEYKEVIRNILERLTPGGIIIDDGIRRSYSRELRIREVQSVLREFGGSYKAYLIRDPSGKPLSVALERGLERESCEDAYISREAYMKHILTPGSSLHELGLFWSAWEICDHHRRVVDLVMRRALAPVRGKDHYFSLLQRLNPVHEVLERKIKNHISHTAMKEIIAEISAQVKGLSESLDPS